ncbi:MAG TPA: cytochrome c peroxidase [Planctomycetota bacterium]|nr:cytochrome c peroxidase [Planctomycetota bacterium]
MIAALLLACLAAGDPPAPPLLDFTPEELARILQQSPLPSAPPDPTNRVESDPRAQRLGQFLFFDPRLSANGAVACATCHQPARSFSDGLPFAQGLATATRHTPALWNVAQNRWFFWDGRADSLWAQAAQPIENPLEMGFTRLGVLRLFTSDPELRAAYTDLFGPLPPLPADDAAAPTPETPPQLDAFYVNVCKCIAAYSRRLVSDHSPFDTFVAGLRDGDPAKLAALAPDAQRGLRLFVGRGQCRLCHSGPNFTDMEFHSTRIPLARPDLRRDSGRLTGIDKVQADPFNGAGAFSDAPAAGHEKLDFLASGPDNIGQFKTPSLRSVALTAPYMHAGQFPTLHDVLVHYSEFADAFDFDPGHFEQMLQPLHLTEGEIADLTAFLGSLTGTGLDPALLEAPAGPR